MGIMPKVIFNIATVYRRGKMFLEILKMMAGQTIPCDKINIAMSYPSIDPNIIRFLRNHFKDHEIRCRPRLACEHKIFNIDKTDPDSYFLTWDDDIFYPSNYAERTIRGIEKYDRKAVVGWHGIRFDKFPILDYKTEKRVHCYYKAITPDIETHTIGTGTMGCYLGTLKEKGFTFGSIDPNANCIDSALGRFCRDNKIRMIVIEHEAGWMKVYPGSQDLNALWKKSARMGYKNKMSYLSDLNKITL
jgi:hypothetical protein